MKGEWLSWCDTCTSEEGVSSTDSPRYKKALRSLFKTFIIAFQGYRRFFKSIIKNRKTKMGRGDKI